MRSAFYYPHTEIRSESLLKTALLLWDEIHVIAPFPRYEPEYSNPLFQRAFEVIGKCKVPTTSQKANAHELIEDFVTRPLPAEFAFRNLSPRPERKIYEIYPQKLLRKTWELLEYSGLVGALLPNADYPTSPAAGLSLMNILADCCAGDAYVRVTDRGDAYASLQGLIADHSENSGEIAINELVPVSIKTVDAGRLSLGRLIEFRENETAASRDLRHKFQAMIEGQAAIIAKSTGPEVRAEALRDFESDCRDDYELLREALKLNAWEIIGSKEIVSTAIGVIGMAATIGLSIALPMPEVVTGIGGTVAIGGLIATKSKFSRERLKLLKEHPTAYLYEVAGGLRL